MSIVARAYTLFVVGFVAWAMFIALRDHGTIPSTDDARILIDMFRMPFWEWVFSSQNGHRVPGTLLLFAADYRWWGGQNHLMIVGSLVTLTLALGVLLFAAQRRGGLASPVSQMAFAAVAFLLFWVASCFNLLCGVCHANTTVVLFAFAALVCLIRYAERNRAHFLILTLVMAGLATLSMGQGVAIWPALILLALVMRLPFRAFAAIAIAALVIGGVAVVSMADFTSEFAHKSPAEAVFLNSLVLLRFVATLIGGVVGSMGRTIGLDVEPLGQQNAVAGLVGLILLATHLRWIRGHPRRANPHDWLAVGVMAFAASVGAGVGATRLFTLGFQTAWAPRFFDWSGLFWAGALISLSAFAQRRGRSGAWSAGSAAAIVAATAVLMLGLRDIRDPALEKLERAYDASLAIMLDAAGPVDLFQIHRRQSGDLQPMLERLKREEKSIYADQRWKWVGTAPTGVLRLDSDARCIGRIDLRTKKQADPGAEWKISGWAWNATADAPPRSVVLVDPEGAIRGLANILRRSNWRRDDKAEWRGRVTPSDERIQYSAYAILEDGVTACPFATEQVPAAKR